MPRRVCVITGSRAEYGILYWVLRDLRDDAAFELQLIVTGMHLALEFGLTVREIEKDGFDISRRVEMLLSSDTRGAVAKSVGLGVLGISDALDQLAPDLVLVLGDRFEILAAVQVCLIHNIPVAHIGGGDTTEGAFDESIRHAVTKMSHIHFVTNDMAARRVQQMGEDPQHIHMVGSPALDHLRRSPLLDRGALEQALGAPLGARNLLVTFHPVTLEGDSEHQFGELLAALETLSSDVTLWFTKPNADTGGRALSATLDGWAALHGKRVHVYTSLGQLLYLSLMAQVDAVVGNSSSGLFEAPSLGIGTVDIGNRQRGRIAPKSVIKCPPERTAIAKAIEEAIAMDCSNIVNPFGDGGAAARIVLVLRDLPLDPDLLKKRFHMMDSSTVSGSPL
ncbi:MAG: neuC [Gemmatimonadetes bacterium]|nr:neuC [Gemmatimonadota bacterium]